MKTKTNTIFTIEENDSTAISTVVGLLESMIDTITMLGYDGDKLNVGDGFVPLSAVSETMMLLDYLWAVGSASIGDEDEGEDDEQLSFDDFDEGVEDYDGHNDEV